LQAIYVDESFQAIICTGTDNSRLGRYNNYYKYNEYYCYHYY